MTKINYSYFNLLFNRYTITILFIFILKSLTAQVGNKVNSTGNIGIGTTSPTSLLNISYWNGNEKPSKMIEISDNTNGLPIWLGKVYNKNIFTITNADEIRFSDSDVYDYDSWGGLKYSRIENKIYLGGSGGSKFSNAGFPKYIEIDMTKENSGVRSVNVSALSANLINIKSSNSTKEAFMYMTSDLEMYSNGGFEWKYQKDDMTAARPQATLRYNISKSKTEFRVLGSIEARYEIALRTYSTSEIAKVGAHDGQGHNYLFMGVSPDDSEISWYYQQIKNYKQPSALMKLNYLSDNDGNNIAKLSVKGHIEAQEIKVHVDAGADYVFEDGYNLKGLSELETYLIENKHLPEIQTAYEMEEDGINLSKMNIILLRKIEELTLYVIELNKQVEILNRNK